MFWDPYKFALGINFTPKIIFAHNSHEPTSRRLQSPIFASSSCCDINKRNNCNYHCITISDNLYLYLCPYDSIIVSLYFSIYQNHYLCHNASFAVSINLYLYLCHYNSRCHNLYLNATIINSVIMPLSMSQCHNQCHTISACTCLKYIPKNNHPSISFGPSTFTS